LYAVPSTAELTDHTITKMIYEGPTVTESSRRQIVKTYWIPCN